MKTASELVEKILTKPPKLSDDQQRAVLSKSRYIRIIAGAGAGKTETLARKIAHVILVEKVKPSSIVAFTFTEKAAQSMKNRIYKTVGEIAGTSATTNLGEMHVGTIHGYAKRILDDHFGFGNYGVLDDNQEVAFLMRHGWNLGIKDYESNYAASCQTFLRTANMAWDEMLDEKELKKKAPEFYEKLKKYEALLDEHKLLTFGRMVLLAVQKLRESPDALHHVERLIVDEYQDINRAQAELIRIVGANASIFVVGDLRQTIYQWRGSNEKFFEIFSDTFQNVEMITIRENWRSVKKIVKNANKFAETFKRARYESMNPTRGEDGFISVSSQDTPEAEARWVVDQIEELTKTKKIKYSDVGVLTRSVSTSAGPLIDELKARRIPYIVGGKVGLFRRDEGQAMGRILSWLCDDGFWVPNPWKWREQVKGDDLLSTGLAFWNTAHMHGTPDDAADILKQIKADLNSAKSPYENFTTIYHAVLTALGFHRLNHEDKNDAAVMANLGRFHSLLTDYESANRIGGRTPHWKQDLKGLCWFMNSYAIQSYEEQPSDDIRGVDAVQVMTIHQAKGLEWPIVFLFATVRGRFPSKKVGDLKNWCGVPRSFEGFDARRYEGEEEDERKLFYVAITRAKDALIVTHFRRKTNNFERSPFIENMDEEVITALKDGKKPPDLTIHPASISEEMQTFSASEIIKYDICPYMYLLGNVWGYQPGLNERIGFGKSLHYCLRRAGDLVKKGYSPISAVATAVEDFHVPYAGGDVFDQLKNGAKKMLIGFAKECGDDLKRIEEVEYRLEYPIPRVEEVEYRIDYPVPNATIMGKVDVILRDGGHMEVREYKTSEEARTFEETAVQVRLYAAGLKSLGRPIKSGSVAYLEEAKVEPVTIDESLLEGAKKSAGKTVESIMKGQFKPNPGEKTCERCDHHPICRWGEKLT